MADRDAPDLSRYLALCAAARHALERHDLAAAIAHVIDALAEEARRPEAWNLLGAYRERCGDRLQAARAYRTAVAIDPADGEARWNLARLGEDAGLAAEPVEIGMNGCRATCRGGW
jgi:Flp pilus assembly protein TadD